MSSVEIEPVEVTVYLDGFGGLVVSMLASGTRVRGFKTGRSDWIFWASSFGGEVKESVPALQHVAPWITNVLAKFLV